MHIIGGEEASCQAREMEESVGGKNSLAKWNLHGVSRDIISNN